MNGYLSHYLKKLNLLLLIRINIVIGYLGIIYSITAATHGSVRPDRVLRLMPKQGATVEGFVHESIYSPFQARLSKPLYHYTYDNWEQYFNKFNPLYICCS